MTAIAKVISILEPFQRVHNFYLVEYYHRMIRSAISKIIRDFYALFVI